MMKLVYRSHFPYYKFDVNLRTSKWGRLRTWDLNGMLHDPILRLPTSQGLIRGWCSLRIQYPPSHALVRRPWCKSLHTKGGCGDLIGVAQRRSSWCLQTYHPLEVKLVSSNLTPPRGFCLPSPEPPDRSSNSIMALVMAKHYSGLKSIGHWCFETWTIFAPVSNCVWILASRGCRRLGTCCRVPDHHCMALSPALMPWQRWFVDDGGSTFLEQYFTGFKLSSNSLLNTKHCSRKYPFLCQ